MNDFRLQCAKECYDGYFSLHPASKELIRYKIQQNQVAKDANSDEDLEMPADVVNTEMPSPGRL